MLCPTDIIQQYLGNLPDIFSSLCAFIFALYLKYLSWESLLGHISDMSVELYFTWLISVYLTRIQKSYTGLFIKSNRSQPKMEFILEIQ